MRQWRFRGQFASKKRKVEIHVPDPQIDCFDDVISDATTAKELAKDAQLLWNIHGGDKSYAKSFWIAEGDEPKCLLEKFAKQIGEWHSWNLSEEEGYLGVEYWVQLRKGDYYGRSLDNCEHGLDFHFDKDEKAAAETDEWFHPTLSTVTYLDCQDNEYPAGGTPLVIYETRSEGKQSRFPKHSWIVHPVPNSHVVFDGDLLHGVPSDLTQFLIDNDMALVDSMGSNSGNSKGDKNKKLSLKYSRLSIAVNIWTKHVPRDLKRLDIVAFEKAAEKAAQQAKESSKSASSSNIPDIELNASDHSNIQHVTSSISDDFGNYEIKEHREGDTAPLPLKEIKTEFRRLLKNQRKSSLLDENDDFEVNNVIAVTYKP